MKQEILIVMSGIPVVYGEEDVKKWTIGLVWAPWGRMWKNRSGIEAFAFAESCTRMCAQAERGQVF